MHGLGRRDLPNRAGQAGSGLTGCGRGEGVKLSNGMMVVDA